MFYWITGTVKSRLQIFGKWEWTLKNDYQECLHMVIMFQYFLDMDQHIFINSHVILLFEEISDTLGHHQDKWLCWATCPTDKLFSNSAPNTALSSLCLQMPYPLMVPGHQQYRRKLWLNPLARWVVLLALCCRTMGYVEPSITFVDWKSPFTNMD